MQHLLKCKLWSAPQAEESKKRQKEDRRKEQMKRRSGLTGLQQDAEKRNREFDKKVR